MTGKLANERTSQDSSGAVSINCPGPYYLSIGTFRSEACLNQTSDVTDEDYDYYSTIFRGAIITYDLKDMTRGDINLIKLRKI